MRYILRRVALYAVILLIVVLFFIPVFHLIEATYNPRYTYGEALVDGLQHGWRYFVSIVQGNLSLSILGISAPAFFLIVILQAAVIRTTLTTGIRLMSVGGFGWDGHLILPTIVLAARPMAQVARVSSVILNHIFNQDYIRTALAKGLSTGQMFRQHALKNAAISWTRPARWPP